MTKSLALGLVFLSGLAAQVNITSTSPLPSGNATVSYSFTLTASGGNPPYTWTLTGGQLPGGMGLASNGLISGTTNISTVASFTVQVADSSVNTLTNSMAFTLAVAPLITNTSLQPYTVNEPYPSTPLNVVGLSGSPGWSSMGLPNGMFLDSGGNVTGTPTVSGSFTPTFSVTDPSGAVGTATIPLTINAAPAITDNSPLPAGDVAVAYSYQFGTSPVSGGTPPYTWSTPSQLPPGLTLSPAGLLAGTPTITGLYTFKIQVEDASSATASKTFALVVGTLPVVITELNPPPASTIGVPYPPPPAADQPPYFQASRGTGGGYTWTAAGLPPGLGVNPVAGPQTGITGIPTAAGTFPASVTAADSANEMGTFNFNVTINPAPAINSGPLQACTAGTFCTRTLVVTGGTAPFNWTLASGAVPAGMSFSNAGVISGIPSAVASPTTASFSVTVTDVATASNTQQFSLVVNPGIVISPASLPATTSGLAYSQTFTTTGGTGAITFTATGLPAWLGLTAGGVLSGTAPAVASATPYAFSVKATDSDNASATNQYTVVVNPLPAITNASPLPSWTVNRPYTQTITATGGTGALTFSDNGATLPAWLTITGAGVLSGTPPVAGPVSFTLRVTDSLSAFSATTFALTINPPPSVSTTSLPATTSGIAYSQTLAETGGTTPFTWQATGLPAWLNLSAAGVLSGTAPAENSATPFNFSVTVTDTAGAVSSPQSLSVTVNPALQITTASPLPATESGLSYAQTLAATGGTGAITWTSGNLPQWLSLSPAGTLSGTAPSVAAATPYSFNVTATDSVNATGGKAFTVTVNPLVTIATASPLPPWTLNQPYSQAITASGGIPGYTFADAGSTLPSWLAISAGGSLTGTPTATGTFLFTLRVTDSISGTNTKAFSLTINPRPSLTTLSLPATTSGLMYSQTLTATGGTGALIFIAAGLPPWLTLNGATLSGTAPVVAAPTTYNFSVTVADSTGAVSPMEPLSVTVNPGVIITTSSPLPTVGSGTAFSQTFAATGGTGAIAWTFGNLPGWLTQNGATLSGTAPTVAQPTTYMFTATATDSLGATSGSQQFSVTVSSGVIITTAATLGPWTATRPFTATLTASGGTPPYTFMDAGQTLPVWLNLTGNVLSGTPPSAGTFQFTITATDSLHSSVSKIFTLQINPVPSVSTMVLAATTSGISYSQSLAATGGTPPFAWSGFNLPAWLQVNGPSIAGTAPLVAVATQYSFTVSVTDSAGATSSPQSLSVTVNPPVTITTTSPLPGATAGVPYSVTFAAAGGTGAIAWSVSNAPNWLSLNGSTLSGIPPASAAGTTPDFTIRATDTVGAFASGSFQFMVASGSQSNSSTLPAWTVNRPYSATLTVAGGTPPYSNWALTSGSPPAGLLLNAANGTIAGTPTATGTVTFTVSATDSNHLVFLTTWTLTINPAPAIPSQNLPPASPGTAYSQVLTLTGGTGPFTWSATGLNGSGLALSPNGVLAGLPTGTPPTTITFTATVTDAAGATAQAGLSLLVEPAITISTGALPATTSTASYSAAIQATGGTGAIGFSAAGLPAWLSLSAQGALTGIAPTVGAATDFGFTVTATDSVGVTASKHFTIVVNPVPKVLTVKLPAGTAGAPYSAQLLATGGTGALVWSAQNLPAWASLNSASGVISGTPPSAATVNIQVVVTDSLGIASPPDQLALAIVAPGGTPTITTVCPFSPTTATIPFGVSLDASGGFPPYNWSATGLPSWLVLNPNGTFSGTAVAGASAFDLQLTDSHGQSASLGCGLTVNPAPAVSAASLPPGTVGAPYAQNLSAFGGTGPLVWSAASLPAWLTLDPLTGLLSGTPNVSGNYTFTVQVVDSLSAASTPVPFTIPVTGEGGVPTITACPLPTGSVGAPMAFQLTAALGFPPYSWSANGLPAGLTASGAGVVTGTPSAAGIASVALAATDTANSTANATCAMSISAAPAVTTASLPNGTVGAFYWQTLAASGGIGALRWSISGAPAWMSLDPISGILSGTPTSAGLAAFTVQVTDSHGTASPAAALSVNVTAPGGGIVVTTSCPLPPITQSMLLDEVFTATGGAPPYSWTAVGLPATVTLDPSGALLGTPAAGTISFSVLATDQQKQQTAPLSCSVAVNRQPAISTASLPNGIAGTPYQAILAATGGTLPLSWSATHPYWLNIDPLSGDLFGTPPASGPVTTTVRVADQNGIANSKTFSFTVAPPSAGSLPALTSACPLPGATVGVRYSDTLTAAGGSAPYQFLVFGLPSGLTSNSGVISGIAQAAGSLQLVLEVIDASGTTATNTCGLTVSSTALSIVVTAPAGRVNQGYVGGFAVTGGVAPYAWSISSGTLPPGIGLNMSTGALTGTPTTAGTYPLTATVTDFNGATASANASITISPVLVITTLPTLPAASGGSAYQLTLTYSGAGGAVTWSIVSGALPTGLTLNPSTGVISGTPTQGGTFALTVQAVDTSGQTAQLQLTLKVNLTPIPQVTITGLPSTVTPDQQLTPTVTVASPYPLDITGQLNLTVTANSSIGLTDPAVVFAGGGTSVQFRIAANSTQAVFTSSPAFQTGTLAETLTLNVALTTGGVSVQPPASASVTGQVPKLAPMIVGTPAVTRTANGLQVTFTAFATSRDVTSATFQFIGSNLQSSSVTVPLSSLVGAWFSSAQSDAYGSLFQIVQPFTVTGSASQITGVTITLTNSVGTSTAVTVSF